MPQCIWWCEAISDALHRISLYISFSIFNSGVSFFINRMQNHLFGCTSSIPMRKSKSQDLIRLLAGTKSKKGYHDSYRLLNRGARAYEKLLVIARCRVRFLSMSDES